MLSPHQKLINPMMPRWLRRTIMLFLFACFFITAPLVIAYTAGFRIDFTTGEILQRGVLSIDIEPRQANIFIDDVMIKKNMPIRLANRAPGVYTIRMETPGYITWQQNIEIKSNRTTYIRDVELIRTPAVTKIDGITHVQHVFGNPLASHIGVSQIEDGIHTISAMNKNTYTMTPLARVHEKNNPMYFSSPFQPYIAIIPSEQEPQLHLISLSNPTNPTIFDIQMTPQHLQWTNNRFSPAYIQLADMIYELSFVSGNMTPRFTLGATNTIWYVDNSQQLWTYTNNTLTRHDKNIEYTLKEPITGFLDMQNNTLIATTDSDTRVLYINDQRVEVSYINGNSHRYNPLRNEWIVWSPWELNRIHADGGVQFLTRSSDYIHDVTIFDENGLLLLRTGNGLFAFNATFYVWHHLDIDDVDNILTSPQSRELFFTRSGTTQLFKTTY